MIASKLSNSVNNYSLIGSNNLNVYGNVLFNSVATFSNYHSVNIIDPKHLYK